MRLVNRVRTPRGAAAVEAGLVSTFLAPLLVGVLVFGNYFWHAQKFEAYAARIPQGSMVGVQLTCEQVVALVKDAVVQQSRQIGDTYLPDLSVDQVAVTVVEVLPDARAIVHISVESPTSGVLSSLLPDGGVVSSEATMRLENVTVSTSVCS